MSNPLANFMLMDIVNLKDHIVNEQASKQAVEIIEAIKRAFLRDPDAKYATYSDNYNSNPKLIHAKNIEHLSENGFSVWRVSAVIHTNRYYKYFICWDVDNFEKEVFEDCMADKNYILYDYVELTKAIR
jgi:hypothetical protein